MPKFIVTYNIESVKELRTLVNAFEVGEIIDKRNHLMEQVGKLSKDTDERIATERAMKIYSHPGRIL